MARAKREEVCWRAKWTCDGCKSLEEMAVALEEAAASIRKWAEGGAKLKRPVEDDYAFISVPVGLVK
jgi:hypothetical protein